MKKNIKKNPTAPQKNINQVGFQRNCSSSTFMSTRKHAHKRHPTSLSPPPPQKNPQNPAKCGHMVPLNRAIYLSTTSNWVPLQAIYLSPCFLPWPTQWVTTYKGGGRRPTGPAQSQYLTGFGFPFRPIFQAFPRWAQVKPVGST